MAQTCTFGNPLLGMKKILLVEDEINLVHFIRKGLSEEGYEVSVALSGEIALQMAADGVYDLIILDIMLPGKNGIDVCSELRENKISTPILFLTALGTAENIALGLNTGADDYLTKPFKFIEFSARVKALLRRGDFINASEQGPSQDIYTIADLEVNDLAKTAKRAGKLIVLTANEYRLLLALVKNQGHVLSRTDLLESAWDMNFDVNTNLVDVYINYLRKKVDTDTDNKLIHTVKGMGYVVRES